jgi:hypothetical protein
MMTMTKMMKTDIQTPVVSQTPTMIMTQTDRTKIRPVQVTPQAQIIKAAITLVIKRIRI